MEAVIDLKNKIPFLFRGIPAFIHNGRIPDNERESKYHYYGIRHEDFDWDKPATVEPDGWVNFWGTLICTYPLTFEDLNDPHIDLNEDDIFILEQNITG